METLGTSRAALRTKEALNVLDISREVTAQSVRLSTHISHDLQLSRTHVLDFESKLEFCPMYGKMMWHVFITNQSERISSFQEIKGRRGVGDSWKE